MGSKRVFGIVLIVVALLAAACGGRSDDDDTAADDDTDVTETSAPVADDDDATADDDAPADDDDTTPEDVDPCEGVTLEATETGVTAETITIVAMADVDSALAARDSSRARGSASTPGPITSMPRAASAAVRSWSNAGTRCSTRSRPRTVS